MGGHKGPPEQGRIALRMLAPLLFALAVAACSTLGLGTRFDPRSVHFQSDPLANENSAVPVYLVVVYSRELDQVLAQTKAADWIARRGQFEKDYPGGMKVWTWEIVPGYPPSPEKLGGEVNNAVGAFIFADYRTEGEHRARVDPRSDAILIKLARTGMTVDGM